jgi:phosphate transport system substrate-binding protein
MGKLEGAKFFTFYREGASRMVWQSRFVAVMTGGVLLVLGGCKQSSTPIRVEGSDTMIQVAQAWAEEYQKQHPDASLQVSGGGSGRGIAALVKGTCDLADSSRKMTDEEVQRVTEKYKVEPVEHIVGYDALAVFVHKSNPLNEISLEELAEIYGEKGKIAKWSDLGVRPPGGSDAITCVGRQNSSGTYVFFREHVLGKERDYRADLINQNGSKEVVALVATTPSAIGYSGMGYLTDEVKMLKVSARKGGAAVEATVENARKGTYPLTRPLQIYTRGEGGVAAKKYLDWIYGPEGQKIVEREGYVPL